MPLKFAVSQDEFDALPEHTREHYIQSDDGFTLAVDGESNEAITGLKSALEQERSDRKSFESKVSELSQAMQSVNTELETLRQRDAETSLRKAVVACVPEMLRPEAISDVLLVAQKELSTDQGGSSYVTGDGKSLDEWMGSLLEKKPHWLKPSVGGGESGSSQNTPPRSGPMSLQNLMGQIFH